MSAPADPAADWVRAVDLGARGEYDASARVLAEIGAGSGRWASLAQSTLGSYRRQTGDPVSAASLDAQALAIADDDESRADALIGLAADAVASGDIGRAGPLHVEAADPSLVSWRTRTRWHWVAAEIAVAEGAPDRASAHARDALLTCAGESSRHEAKSRIVLAAVTGQAEHLPEVAHVVGAAGWRTLAWPLALVAADHPAGLEAGWLERAWQVGRDATYAIEEHLPPDWAGHWQAHPGVERLRASPTGAAPPTRRASPTPAWGE